MFVMRARKDPTMAMSVVWAELRSTRRDEQFDEARWLAGHPENGQGMSPFLYQPAGQDHGFVTTTIHERDSIHVQQDITIVSIGAGVPKFVTGGRVEFAGHGDQPIEFPIRHPNQKC